MILALPGISHQSASRFVHLATLQKLLVVITKTAAHFSVALNCMPGTVLVFYLH